MRVSVQARIAAAIACAAIGASCPESRAETAPPNIVLVLTDDQDAASWSYMSALQSRIVAPGTLFPAYFNSVSLCCPSRSTILRGQYPRNHGVLTNRPPSGGFGRFFERGNEASTVAVWLREAGYRTALFGKYLNGYPDRDGVAVPATHVPRGWSEWASPVGGAPYSNFNYTLNENGSLVAYGEEAGDDDGGLPAYHGVRTADRTYVEYAGGARELYDLVVDPYQLNSLHATDTVGVCRLSAAVAAMRDCAGERCRVAEEQDERMAGDCGGDDRVTIDEIVRGVGIALGGSPLDSCRAFDIDGDAAVSVDELVRAVSAALGTC